MQAVDIPSTRVVLPFGEDAGAGFIRTIPVPSQIGTDDGAASYQTGFPPLNFDPVGSGGIPPDGRDFNGILFEISAWTRWYNTGGVVLPYSAAVSAEIAGYPNGAIVASVALAGVYWRSVVDANTVDPDAGPSANWVSLVLGDEGVRIVTSSANFTLDMTDQVVGLRRITSVSQTSITIPSQTRIGQKFKVQDLIGNFSGNNNVTMIPPAGCTIGNASTWVLNEDFDAATFQRFDATVFGVDR